VSWSFAKPSKSAMIALRRLEDERIREDNDLRETIEVIRHQNKKYDV
jgi:hypothetical protein